MIHRIYSSLASFKELTFHPGLNIILARKAKDSGGRQTRNRAGKSSIIEIIHFLMGAKVDPDSPFRTSELIDEMFGMDFDLRGIPTSVQRRGSDRGKIHVCDSGTSSSTRTLSNAEWTRELGAAMFALEPDVLGRLEGPMPTFRSLYSYFVRRQASGGFTTPEKQATMQQTGDYQVALMFLLGLDWTIASEWRKVRAHEKTLSELRKAMRTGALGSVIGRTSDLRTQLTVKAARLQDIKQQLASFRVLPQYRALEREVNEVTERLNALSDADTIDNALMRDLEMALEMEAPPATDALERLYEEAGVVLPGNVVQRYEDVRIFHESIIRNRREYLSAELARLRHGISEREKERQILDARRSEIMSILQTHGALDQYTKLQSELSRYEAEVEDIRRRFEAAERLESTKSELEIERNQLTLRLQRDFTEQNNRLARAILGFEDISRRLYESAGEMTVEATANGPRFKFPMQGSRSKGIKKMQIFSFDLMLVSLAAERGIGPGFLVHDSHLFDGVDGRQVISALKVGSEMASKFGFQYIVTLNEDDAFKETAEGFDVREYTLPVIISDAEEDGGLFGIRF